MKYVQSSIAMNTPTSWKKAYFHITVFVVIVQCLTLFLVAPTNAIERKKANWLASCPEVIDLTPQLPTKKTQTLRFNTGQEFRLLSDNSTEFVTEPQSIIGCYVFEEFVTKAQSSPAYQIGSLNRDLEGFYFKNAAGITWRLTLGVDQVTFETTPDSMYYRPGGGFKIDEVLEKAPDCKVRDFFQGGIRLGFPRSPDRAPSIGTTRNVILVVDFSDAPLKEDAQSLVDDVISLKTIEKFFEESSNGKFTPRFDLFPKVIRMNSPESSFGFVPNSPESLFNNGVQQDHRLIQEAVQLARLQGSLDQYQTINVFAPTPKSLGYYGAAHLGLTLDVGARQVTNSQLIGQVGTISSTPPSWKSFAHEYGHLLGMYDYYIYSSDGRSGKSPGPFDLMGNTTGNASTFFGFQRWVQSWISDGDVICDLSPSSSVNQVLSPLNSLTGDRLYVHPLNGYQALVIEYRTDSEFDKLNGNDGLLVYLVDMKINSGKGSVSIQPSLQDLVLNPRDDVHKYSKAPLSPGQFVEVNNFVVSAESIIDKKASFRIFTKSEFIVYQDAEGKASAELKAKQEAEANAAAELKAKQEAELKSQQEAAVKAAATKKTTITCVKGKITKKVTALKPKCPTGYKVKK
jgi:M6 family metalloprotease-like protein